LSSPQQEPKLCDAPGASTMSVVLIARPAGPVQ
jgi:hypothetical protein